MNILARLTLCALLTTGFLTAETWTQEVNSALQTIVEAAEKPEKIAVALECVKSEIEEGVVEALQVKAKLEGELIKLAGEIKYSSQNFSINVSGSPALIDLSALGTTDKEILKSLLFVYLESEEILSEAFTLSIPVWETADGALTKALAIITIDCSKLDMEDEEDYPPCDTITAVMKLENQTLQLSINGQGCTQEFQNDFNEEIGFVLEMLKEQDEFFLELFSDILSDALDSFDEIQNELKEELAQ